MIKLRLSLPCPLNRMKMPHTIFKNGRRISILILTKEYRNKKKRLVLEVMQQLGGKPQPITKDVQVSYTITPATKKTPDVDAYEKALLDGLAEAGVYLNDRQAVHVVKERLPTPSFPGFMDVEIHEIN